MPNTNPQYNISSLPSCSSVSLILVGAPQAAGQGALSGSRPGALFRCPVSPEEYDCERVDIDGEVSLDKESKDNQWLGVTVKSQGIGGKVVTCAHLYELRQRVRQPSETRDPIGRCYVLSEDLTERDDLDGASGSFARDDPRGTSSLASVSRACPSASLRTTTSSCSERRELTTGKLSVCLSALTFPPTGEMRVQLLNQTLLDLGFYDDGPYEVADQKQLNAQLIPVPYHSYLGISPRVPLSAHREGPPGSDGTPPAPGHCGIYRGFVVDEKKDKYS
ncbi:hypothetical protein WMY93_026375 [Mugilogobius chulae]|uniref:Uncharacterized protein n=1 Tax=Mugilogobius chulae TaxID=88201 RepID=A0AAW0MYA7_9GOBI